MESYPQSFNKNYEDDELNDETFGDSGPLNDDWELNHQKKARELELQHRKTPELPSFFQGTDDGQLDVSLEPEGLETIDEGGYFPTAKPGDSDDFFFLENETEMNAQLDSQMASAFTLVLDDEEEGKQTSQPQRSTSIPIGGGQRQTFGEMGSPLASDPIWTSPASLGSEKRTTESIWGSPHETQWKPLTPPTGSFPRPPTSAIPTPTPSSAYHPNFPPVESDSSGLSSPLSKFFGAAVTQPLPAPPTQKIRSLAEVEAQMRQAPTGSPGKEGPVAVESLLPNGEGAPFPTRSGAPPVTADHYPPLGAAPPPKRSQKHTPSSQSSRDSTTPQRPVQQYRPRWKTAKQRMTAAEIEGLIRLQEAQLHGSAGNPFAEDFYFLMQRQRPETGAVTLHQPLFETKRPTATPVRREGLEGVLGRIPSHSVRAPRALLQLSTGPLPLDTANPSSASSKVIQSLLLNIENAYNHLLEVQDIDLILHHPASANHFNIPSLRAKREELTNELFKSLHVFIPPQGTLPERKDDSIFVYPEDDIFVNMTLVKKGKKLIIRALPVLFQHQVLAIFFVYLRNLSLIVTSPRLEIEVDQTHKLFGYMFSIINVATVPQVILAFQTILSSHSNADILRILQTKFGLGMVQSLLKRGHDLQLSLFSREEQFSPPNSAGYHWKETIKSFVSRMSGQFQLLVRSEIGQTSKIWEFLAVLVVNISVPQKGQLMAELQDILRLTPSHPTVAAFLQLVGEP